MSRRSHQKVISTNFYRRMKNTKSWSTKLKIDQAIENLLLSGAIFTKTGPDSFYISNDDVIIKNFNDITLLRQDINEKENKIRDLNHCFEILSEVSELKLNDVNNPITSINTAVNNITSFPKAKNDCSKINSNKVFEGRVKK